MPPDPALIDSALGALENNRVLVIDDNRAIHDDFRKILSNPGTNRTHLDAAAATLFGVPAKPKRTANFHLESAFQGKDGAAMAEAALGRQQPYAMAFVDMRMPPGWDGLETIARLWQTQPDLQVVLCTAHSDYSLDEIQEKVDVADRLLILKKPFDTVEVMQLTQALTEKWRLASLARVHTAELTRVVGERTAELRQSAKFLGEQARLLDLATDAIAVLDLDGIVQFWNAGARGLYGWPPESVVGRPVVELLFLVRSDFTEARARLLACGEWHGEMVHRTSAGSEVTVSSRWTLVSDEAGHPRSILVISTDITEQKQLQQQFLRAQRMESIGTLASGVAHDLNNILAPILMCAPMLHEEMPLAQKTSLISVIEKSAARGAQIVKQVLAFGRGLEGDHQPIDLRTLIKEIVQIASETFPKNVCINCGVAPDLCKILGDQTQWHQVFLNLSVNARDAMPDGGTLHLKASNLEVDEHYATMQPALTPGPHVIIEVSDNGSGMPPEVADRIFDPFFTTKAVGQGTGLGLSTVLGIVKSHQGIIEVASVPGRGTTFRIVLPATGTAPGLEGEHPPAEARPRGRGELILVVDDEEGIRHAARSVLEQHGYTTLLAADGPEGLGVYAQNSARIAAVITDIMMPFMDGIALIRALRRMKAAAPVIASTGQGERARLAEIKALGVHGILHKPYPADALLIMLHRALHPAPAAG